MPSPVTETWGKLDMKVVKKERPICSKQQVGDVDIVDIATEQGYHGQQVVLKSDGGYELKLYYHLCVWAQSCLTLYYTHGL